MKTFTARFLWALLPTLIVGGVPACLSTESGNPEGDSAATAGGDVPLGSSVVGPSPDSSPSVSPSGTPVSPSATAMPTATALPTVTVTPTATLSPGASASGTDAAIDTAETLCEFGVEADAGASDAGALLYRCSVVDGGVSCSCGNASRAADPSLPEGATLSAGKACDAALLEQCGRAFP